MDRILFEGVSMLQEFLIRVFYPVALIICLPFRSLKEVNAFLKKTFKLNEDVD